MVCYIFSLNYQYIILIIDFMIGETQCGLLKYTYSLSICDYNLDVAKTEYLKSADLSCFDHY